MTIHLYFFQNMSRLVRKQTMWFPNRSETNRPVQAQKRARSLKFWFEVEEELRYPSSENKDTNQLHSYCEADLCLCFRLCRLLVFPRGGSYIMQRSCLLSLFRHFHCYQTSNLYHCSNNSLLSTMNHFANG